MVMKARNVIGQQVVVSVTKTRPADTTAYAAGDVISESTSAGSVWTFADVVHTDGGGGRIVRAAFLDDDTGHTNQVALLLFSVTVTGALNDNGANTSPLLADSDNFIGSIDFDASKDYGTGFSFAVATEGNSKLPLPFRCEGGDKDIYGVLVAVDALTPSSGEIFRINLQIDQD